MYVKFYFDKPDWFSHSNKKFMNGLSPMERKLAKRLGMVKIKGKEGHTCSCTYYKKT